ncbi:MAG: class I SAM-dependent methyltransferase [Candidatus Nanopelagicales bacterium]|jgi:SAM-dependent methyltransferase|nr:class I SAM-dependent methyltransferase [Candidatus Nanopelagicales bacterium]
MAEEPTTAAPGTPGQGPEPDLAGFARFMAAMSGAFPEKSYRWTKAKERSCDWLIERVPAGARGVDIGGTEYLCEHLAAKGCDVTYYDFVAPRTFTGPAITDDMFNVLRHFEPGSLDFITTRHTLEHSFVPLFQLWAYNQLLADDGRLLVTVPAYHDRWVWMTTHFHCVPPDSWHMLFHRAGFRVAEFEIGTWKPQQPEFVEHRFLLRVESRELRLAGRPERTLRTPDASLPGGWAIVKPEPDPALPPDAAAARVRAEHPPTGQAAMVGRRRWFGRRD